MLSAKKKLASLVLSGALMLSTVGVSFASNQDELKYGLPILSTKTEVLKLENGGELTVTEELLRGSASDLDRIVQEYTQSKGGRVLVTKSTEMGGVISPMVDFGESEYVGSASLWNDVIQSSVNVEGQNTLIYGGAGGFSATGTNVCNIVRNPSTSADVTNYECQPRARFKVWGIVGGTSVIVRTYDYRATTWNNLNVWSYNESEPGIVAVLTTEQGADFRYNLNGGSNSYTLWADLRKP